MPGTDKKLAADFLAGARRRTMRAGDGTYVISKVTSVNITRHMRGLSVDPIPEQEELYELVLHCPFCEYVFNWHDKFSGNIMGISCPQCGGKFSIYKDMIYDVLERASQEDTKPDKVGVVREGMLSGVLDS